MTLARISQHEIEPLPLWARLALAARCVRRARALISPPASQARVLDDGLERLEQAVTTGRARDDLADAAASASTRYEMRARG